LGYKGKVVSFEPLSDVHDILKKRSLNNPDWRVAGRCCLGERNGVVSINVSQNTVSSSLLPMLDTHLQFAPESKYVGTETAPMFTLDTILPEYSDDSDRLFLKLDTQGYEKNILLGAPESLKVLMGIQLECSLIPLYKGELEFIDTVKLIESFGFELQGIIPGFSDSKSGRLLQADCIFFRTPL
jgi:FkbM family methyltransferase